MAKTIDHLNMYVPITPYKVDGINDTFDTLSVSVAYRQGQGFVVYYHAGWSTSWGGWGCVMIGGNSPLTATRTTLVKQASRNSSKELSAMMAALELAKDAIRAHFDARKFDDLLSFMGAVCYSGYTPKLQEDAKNFINAINNNLLTNKKENDMKLTINNNNESVNVQNAQVINPTTAADHSGEYVDFEEVPARAEVGGKKSKERGGKNSKPSTLNSQLYSVTTYETKKGKTAALIFGFADETAAKAIAAKMPSSGCSSSWRYGDNGQKRYCLSVSPRYVEVAKTLCDALNAGDKKAIDKACKDSCAIYDKVVAEGMAAREAKKQEREAKKSQTSKLKSQTSTGYSPEDVAAMLKDVLAGKDIPEDVKKLMAA